MKTRLRGELSKTEICVVGEPTEMQVAISHKGKTVFRAACIGPPGHSALSPKFVNALCVATDFVHYKKFRKITSEVVLIMTITIYLIQLSMLESWLGVGR